MRLGPRMGNPPLLNEPICNSRLSMPLTRNSLSHSANLQNGTEASVRPTEIFDPGQQCFIGALINVQKFEAYSPLRDHHTNRCKHLYFLVSVRERSADPRVDL